jgi:hypothetical protein
MADATPERHHRRVTTRTELRSLVTRVPLRLTRTVDTGTRMAIPEARNGAH